MAVYVDDPHSYGGHFDNVAQALIAYKHNDIYEDDDRPLEARKEDE